MYSLRGRPTDVQSPSRGDILRGRRRANKDIVNRPPALLPSATHKTGEIAEDQVQQQKPHFVFAAHSDVVALRAALAAAAPTERTPATYISTTLSKLSS